MMTEQEFKDNAKYLAQKYVKDAAQKAKILSDIDQHGADAAKGILSDICENSGDIEPNDSKIIKDISFNFI